MTSRRASLLLAAAALAAACRGGVGETVLDHGQTVAPAPEVARDVRRLARIGMASDVAFNRAPERGEVALILAAPGTDWNALVERNAATANVRNNCYATPRTRTIVCDSAMFARVDDLVGGPATTEQRVAYARWVIGHELGHLATASAGFDHPPQHATRAQRDLKQQRREYAADCWLVQTFARAMPYDEQIALERFAIDAINAHFRKREPHRPAGVGLIFDYTSADPYDFVSGSTTHPDVVLRGIRLLHVAAQQRDDATLRALTSPLTRKLVPDPLWTARGPCGLS